MLALSTSASAFSFSFPNWFSSVCLLFCCWCFVQTLLTCCAPERFSGMSVVWTCSASLRTRIALSPRCVAVYLAQSHMESKSAFTNCLVVLFARANVALTIFALCARYHASCAAASKGAIKELQTLLRKFVWKGRAPVRAAFASVPRRLGGLGMPNIQAIQDAHNLRFWAQAMNSDED